MMLMMTTMLIIVITIFIMIFVYKIIFSGFFQRDRWSSHCTCYHTFWFPHEDEAAHFHGAGSDKFNSHTSGR